MNLLASRFSIMMGARQREAYVVDFDGREGDGTNCGLYIPFCRNDFGTSLVARGTDRELAKLLAEVRS